MSRTVTILDENVCHRLQRIDDAQLNRLVENFLRSYGLTEADLDAEYAAMADDEEHEREAREWIEYLPDEALEDEFGWEHPPRVTSS